MSYVQAAVYDAVTKMRAATSRTTTSASRSRPARRCRRRSRRRRRRCSTTTCRISRRRSTTSTTPTSPRSAAWVRRGVADGVALGQAAAADIIALRTGDGLNNTAVPSYGGNGPILPGQWQLQPGQKVQTPFVATMRPFLLESPAQFRAPPPPSLTSHLYARDLNETEAYGAINSTVRTPDQTAIAYFWVGFNVNQYNATFQNVVTQHTMDLVDAAHLLAMGNIVTTDAGIACLRLEVLLPVLAPDHGHPERRQGQQPRHDRRPDLAVAPAGAGASRVPVAARLLHQRLRRHDRGGAAHAASGRHHSGRAGRKQRSSPPPSTSTRSTTSTGRSSTPGSGSASTSATRSSRARGSATTSPTGSSTATSGASGRNPKPHRRVARLARATRPAGYFVAVKRPNIDGSCGGQ